MEIHISSKAITPDAQEFVERKGSGHPDTLADALAETLSREYATYTLGHCGAVLHHNFDKLGLLGGASYVAFGEGHLTQPIRVLLNGRASISFAENSIPVRDLLIAWSESFMKRQFPMINPQTDLDFHYNLSSQSSPGKIDGVGRNASRHYWFSPRHIEDLGERYRLRSNDTSLGVGYAPLTKLEKLVLSIEQTLNGDIFKAQHPWIGSDIKVLGFRDGQAFSITMCVPQLADHVPSVSLYRDNLRTAKAAIHALARTLDVTNLEVHINTRDDFDMVELYLTAIGSSIESGDEGLVGRGNRINGLISPGRPMSMEGACGKNPVYHVGKLYNVAATTIANSIHSQFGVENEVYLASQSGRDLGDPWKIVIHLQDGFENASEVEAFVVHELTKIPDLTQQLLQGNLFLY